MSDETWVARQIFDNDGLVAIEREKLTDIEKAVFDSAVHLFLQEQSVRYRRLTSYGVREGVYMAIVYLGVPVEEFEWVGVPLTELKARVELYRQTGEVTL